MHYIFNKGQKNKPIFLLLHGTGADERDLLPLAKMLDDSFGVLSVRGNVTENGMNRYFKRLGFGQYDLEDLKYRGQELLDFITKISETEGFELKDLIPVGFSNGSNIAIHLLLREDVDIKRSILFAPLYPVDVSDNSKDMSDVKVLLSMGDNDPMVSPEDNKYVEQIFTSRGADVTKINVHGHEITNDAVTFARKWLLNN